jgi:hypothetical protein
MEGQESGIRRRERAFLPDSRFPIPIPYVGIQGVSPVKRRRLVVALTAVVLLAGLRPAAAQDAAKAEIRQAIDAAYLNALNGRDIKTFLAGWHQGAVVASLSPTGEVSYQPVIDLANAAARDNVKPPEKKEFTYLYPAIDVTGNIGMADVEVMRGEAIRFTGYLPVVKTKTGWKMVGYTFYFHEDGARPENAAGEADAVKKVVEDTLVRGPIQNNSKEQVVAGISPGCDVNQYDPERDLAPGWGMPNGVVTKPSPVPRGGATTAAPWSVHSWSSRWCVDVERRRRRRTGFDRHDHPPDTSTSGEKRGRGDAPTDGTSTHRA